MGSYKDSILGLFEKVIKDGTYYWHRFDTFCFLETKYQTVNVYIECDENDTELLSDLRTTFINFKVNLKSLSNTIFKAIIPEAKISNIDKIYLRDHLVFTDVIISSDKILTVNSKLDDNSMTFITSLEI